MAESPLKTCWAKDVSPENALPEYPRPQMVRPDWKNLNGLWELEITPLKNGLPENFSSKILVPYPVESALAGIAKRVDETQRIWYRRTFKIPSKWNNKRILLHFGAIDWESEVFIDGHKLGLHRGGYDAFCYDITDALSGKKDHEVIVGVWDPSDQGGQAHGKQKKNPQGIFYTPTSGIWQTVWLEPVSDAYIKDIKIFPDVDGGRLRVKTEIEGQKDGNRIKCEAFSAGASIADFTGLHGEETILYIPDARLWSPEDPYLYDLKLSLLDKDGKILDMIDSYFAMRKTSLGKDEKGITRLFLNNKFIFQLGLLDQGFWPDGLYTAPTDTALRYDIEVMKEMGFNMVRKHVKIEPDRWYYWCDRLGLLVWQDMPNAKNSTAEEKAQFELELERLILGRFNHPSIIMWVPFNEGWGQYDSARITEKIKDMDPTRLVNHASNSVGSGSMSRITLGRRKDGDTTCLRTRKTLSGAMKTLWQISFP
jgi:beta-galactosidase/beta-glucuronidase